MDTILLCVVSAFTEGLVPKACVKPKRAVVIKVRPKDSRNARVVWM